MGDSGVSLDEHVRLLDRVAHAAWHLMDDSGELDTTDSEGRHDYSVMGLDHRLLSDALDALESSGWRAHPEVDSP